MKSHSVGCGAAAGATATIVVPPAVALAGGTGPAGAAIGGAAQPPTVASVAIISTRLRERIFMQARTVQRRRTLRCRSSGTTEVRAHLREIRKARAHPYNQHNPQCHLNHRRP